MIKRMIITRNPRENEVVVASADVFFEGGDKPLKEVAFVRKPHGLTVSLGRVVPGGVCARCHDIARQLLETLELAEAHYPGFERVQATFENGDVFLSVCNY